MNYWLLKSEPNTFSVDDLCKRPQQTEHWDGVRNYQARNYLRAMQVGDLAFFYHSSCNVPGVVGMVKITKSAYPDPTAFDRRSKYYDAQSTIENPRWYVVDVKFLHKFKRVITLQELKQSPLLKNMPLLRKGSRLSVMPVTPTEWQTIVTME